MKLPIETQIKLKKFKPRHYQWPIIDAIEKDGYKRVLAILPRRCLSGLTHITMADGSWKFLRDIKRGDNILSWNGESFVQDTVAKKWSTGAKDTYVIRSGAYLPIVASENHEFAHTSSASKYVKWNELEDIGKNRSLLQYAGRKCHDSSIDTEYDHEIAEFWGYMLADGYVSGHQQPKFTNTNSHILRRVELLARKYFRVQSIWRKKGNAFDIGFTNGTRGGGKSINEVKELFRNEKLDVSKSKQRLPKCVWKWSYDSIIAFFSGLISADGNIYCNEKGFTAKTSDHKVPRSVEITLSCGVSYDYAWDIYWLLRKIGIVPHSPYLERGSNWKVKIGKSSAIKKILSQRIYGKEEAQEKALSIVNQYTKETTVFRGCYRSRFKKTTGEIEVLYDIETAKHHNFVANGYVVHNSGKDITAFNVAIRQCLRKVCVVYYVFPTFSQAKRVIWDSITNDGKRIIDYIPKELIASQNSQEMKIRFVNGSLLQLVGSDNYDALMGTNPYGVIFSEYSLQDPTAYSYIRPILAANDGWALFISTPRGRSNHLYALYEIARESENWKCIRLTLDDTRHISDEAMEQERAELSEDLIQQEFYCSFDSGIEGAYYTKYLDKMRLETRIGDVAWEAGFPVHTAWDLGVRDSTTIIFFQNIGSSIRIIDCYENSKVGLEHYTKVIQNKPYTYGKHIAPHDIKVKEFGTGMTRLEKARQLGVRFIVAPSVSVIDGIESVRSMLNKVWIDSVKCANLVKALDNYRQEYDARNKIYKPRPLHDQHSHWADSMRYLAITLPKTKDNNSTKEELDARYYRAMYGADAGLPAPFRKQH